MCGPYGESHPQPRSMQFKICKRNAHPSQKYEVFWGYVFFNYRWIPHYAHLFEPLYRLLRKGETFEWSEEHSETMRKLKSHLAQAPTLKQPDYNRPIYLTVDSNPIGIGWVISQQHGEERYPVDSVRRFLVVDKENMQR